MGGIAQIARELGIEVSGSDQNVYPPMSTQLEQAGITLQSGYAKTTLSSNPVDMVVVGNALSRGNEAVEYMLDEKLDYESGPEWLKNALLKHRWVIAVSGTHGKTTTASMIAWILEYAGLQPGFLIGGVPENFGVSARLGKPPYFVIEADEYDTAFFDKRSKFVHYQPTTCVINNLEFDHADIFSSLDDIKKQFHHLLRTLPSKGTVIYPEADKNIKDLLAMGCWSQQQSFVEGSGEGGNFWGVQLEQKDGSEFSVFHKSKCVATVQWGLLGNHNVQNAMAAIMAAHSIGIAPDVACKALEAFKSVKRRLEKRGVQNNITVYDDFAHHPTAITETLNGLRENIGPKTPLVAVVDLRSNTMKMGVHQETLLAALQSADDIWIYQSSDVQWSPKDVFSALGDKLRVCESTDDIVSGIVDSTQPGAQVCIMSNGGFDNIHERLLKALSNPDIAA
tara:strand:- start:907 stop:2259 length:1353 start_codon:yes stop_codon:yes gene_type:complete